MQQGGSDDTDCFILINMFRQNVGQQALFVNLARWIHRVKRCAAASNVNVTKQELTIDMERMFCTPTVLAVSGGVIICRNAPACRWRQTPCIDVAGLPWKYL